MFSNELISVGRRCNLYFLNHKTHVMEYESLSLPGSTFTKILTSITSVIFFIFSIMLIEGIVMGEDLEGFFSDVWPIVATSLVIGYLCFSYRIVVSRNQDIITVWRQFVLPHIKFEKKEFAVTSLRADQVTHSGGDDGGSTTYTTLFSGTQVVVKYTGRKRKLKDILPELLVEEEKSVENDDTTIQPFWTNPPV